MNFKILDLKYDDVIQSHFVTVVADYSFAIANLVPLISKLDFQRNPLRASFYARLESDIISGCIMPPLTIAFNLQYKKDAHINEELLLSNICKAFVLDGIQRLNTLARIHDRDEFEPSRPIYLNILICESMDRLLYRMITLNNGQRPMTARHQIEILAGNIFNFDDLPILTVTEKQIKGAKKRSEDTIMSKEVVIKGYLAFISHSINIDNQKIIESKMDELIAEQIMESDISKRKTKYSDVISFINNAIDNKTLKAWFLVPNNFIGFCAAMAGAFDAIQNEKISDLGQSISLFENAFSSIDISKIKLGLARRRLALFFFENYSRLTKLSSNQLLNEISQEL